MHLFIQNIANHKKIIIWVYKFIIHNNSILNKLKRIDFNINTCAFAVLSSSEMTGLGAAGGLSGTFLNIG